MAAASGVRQRCGLLLLTFIVGCGGGGGGIVNTPSVLSVTVNPPSATNIDIGQSVTLSANVEVKNGASQAVLWTSGTPSVATVDASSGTVIGVSGGVAVITAKSVVDNTKTASTSITVNPARVVSVTLNSGARTIRVGENFTVAASVDTRGPLAKTVNFTTSDPTKATVSSSDGINATVTGVAAGGATITATSSVDPSKSASFPVTVTGTVRITSVTPSPVVVRTNTSVKVVPTVVADPGLSTNVNFQITNTTIATVGIDGTVIGVLPGQTSLVITSVAIPSVSLTVPVTVRSGVTSVNLTPDVDTLRPTASRQYSVSVVADPGVSTAVTLSSTNTAVATIDVTGRVTGVAVGAAYVRAVSSVDATVRDSTLVTVVDPCQFFPLITIGGTPVAGTITDASCQGKLETFRYRVTAQSAISLTAATDFAAEFRYLSQLNAWWYFNLSPNQPGTGVVLVAPGQYYATIGATTTARGNYSLSTTPNANIAGFCSVTATTGVSVTLPVNSCSFQPTGQPAGAYNSYHFGMLPYFVGGDRLTINVQTTGFVPLIELHFSNQSPTVAISSGTNAVNLTYTVPASGGFADFWVSSRDAGQVGQFTVSISGPPAGTIGAPMQLISPSMFAPQFPVGASGPDSPRPGVQVGRP